MKIKERHARFCELVAEGLSLSLAYARAYDKDVPEDGTGFPDAIRVSASALAKKKHIADEIARLKKLNAAVRERADKLSPATMNRVMEDVTGAVREAIEVATNAGASEIANRLNKILLTHAGRSYRVQARIAAPADMTESERLAEESLIRIAFLGVCQCQTM